MRSLRRHKLKETSDRKENHDHQKKPRPLAIRRLRQIKDRFHCLVQASFVDWFVQQARLNLRQNTRIAVRTPMHRDTESEEQMQNDKESRRTEERNEEERNDDEAMS